MIYHIDHQATASRAAQRLHQRCGQSLHPGGVESHRLHQLGHRARHHAHGARGTEHPDCHKYRHKIRNNHHSRFKAILCPFYEVFVDIDAFSHPGAYKHQYHAEKDNVCDKRAVALHLLWRQSGEIPHHADHHGKQT